MKINPMCVYWQVVAGIFLAVLFIGAFTPGPIP
jgi:hypothetical protein